MSMDEQMTPSQVRLLKALAHEIMGTGKASEYLSALRAENPRPTRRQASAWIDDLKAKQADRPRQAPRARGGLPTVPAGRYAIEGVDGETYTYKVDRPTEGRFSGYTFVTWERPNGAESKVTSRRSKSILEAIAEDPKGAMVAYGRRTGVCGMCGRKLTDPASIEEGIGPICARRLGG